jgi:hypothetical protein
MIRHRLAWAVAVAVVVGSVAVGPSPNAQVSPCTYTIDTSRLHYSGEGGARGITIATLLGCPWTVTGLPAWMQNLSGLPQDFATTRGFYLRLSAEPNPDPMPRSATITVAGHAVDIRQLADGTGARPYLLFWQHQTLGYLSWWQIQGHTLLASGPLTPARVADTNWRVVATADFNRDGHVDLVWLNVQTGKLTVWLMNGTAFAGAGLLQPDTVSDLRWALRASGDMDGDGHVDLIWQHTGEGWLVVWLMDGLRLRQAVPLTPNRVPDTQWRIVAARDFNDDGHLDLLWQRNPEPLASHVVSVWLMRGTEFVAPGINRSEDVRNVTSIKALVDADGDGQADLIGQGGGNVLLYGWDGTVPYTLGPEFFGRIFPALPEETPWLIVGPR